MSSLLKLTLNSLSVTAKPKAAKGDAMIPKKSDGHVGFADLPNQLYRRSVRNGFEFTLMVVGESGLGKSTLINSLFLSDVYTTANYDDRIKQTLQIEASTMDLEENGVRLKLTLIDTPGFGDAIDNTNCWQPIIDFIQKRFDEYIQQESRIDREYHIVDTRVHCCLYFIPPTGHSLRPIDIEYMKQLHDKVNIVPIIAKADTMTEDECKGFKRRILKDLRDNKIRIFEFQEVAGEDEDYAAQHKSSKESIPFAVVGSNTKIQLNGGKEVRVRKYPWGMVEVENNDHSDFIHLRNVLIRTHMFDLIYNTSILHYENYRYRKGGSSVSQEGTNYKMRLAKEEEEVKHRLDTMEARMSEVYDTQIKEKIKKYKDSEMDIKRRHEHLAKSNDQLRREYEEKKKKFEKEKSDFIHVSKKIEEAQLSAKGHSTSSLPRSPKPGHKNDKTDGKEKKKKKLW
ncbi:Septin-7 [Trichoplax sp. H2]|nr:Septin-7 [Trichoplax sp. H2]|eukprot:RDD46993.1 Septin-7 [Trichoplax sp. H2]